jgi:phosphoribosylanthranilate isomerase
MLKVKICGITNIEDALGAAGCGADALGFVFYEKSPRHIRPEDASPIIRSLPPFITTVGVFVDVGPGEVDEIMDRTGLDIAQFHGDEPPGACRIKKRAVKALRVKGPGDIERLKDYEVSAFLLDAYVPDVPGGTGVAFNWDIAREAKKYGRIILAGGLTPENVEEAVRHVRPYGVDVSSGVEMEKGRKDHERLRLFIERARGAAGTD